MRDRVLWTISSSWALVAAAIAGCASDRRPAPPPATTSLGPAATAAASIEPPVAPASAAASASAAPLASAAPDASGVPEGMVEIPAGIYLMGTRNGHGSPEEWPMHEAIVAAFYLDRTEVTTGAYVACMNAGACTKPHEDNPYCNTTNPRERDRHPINCIDWSQADAYCRFAKGRLPTEREWEYAARGGAEQRKYSWGEEDPTPDRACYLHLGSCPVASFAPGAFGLHDISGNVWEWTSSWYGNYPHEPKSGRYRVYRGGSWSRRFPKWLANGLRNRYLPGEWSASVGVRCARSKDPLTCPKDTAPKDGDCVRVSGTPTCEPLYAWNGDACTPGGTPTLKGPGGGGPAPEAPVAAAPDPDAPVTRTRTPEHDDDCKAHYARTPAAYRFSGSTFHKRNGPIRDAGCTRRDMGQTWTSACCPG